MNGLQTVTMASLGSYRMSLAILMTFALLVGACGSTSTKSQTAVTETTVTGTACTLDETVVPPWVVGDSRRPAVLKLRNAGLRVRVFPENELPAIERVNGLPPGHVIGQFPERGQRTCEGGTVWLVVEGG